MKRIRVPAWIACAVFLIHCLALIPSAEESGMGHFKKVQEYSGQFSDVVPSDWYYGDVVSAFEYGIIAGTNGKFNPAGNVTIAEAFAFAARILCIYNGGDPAALAAKPGEAWYQGYVDYCESQHLYTMYYFEGEYEKYASRAEVAYLFARCLPIIAYPLLNPSIDSVPDMNQSQVYYDEVLRLLRTGIATGTDSAGNFSPYQNITRAETAVLLHRLVDPTKRMANRTLENGLMARAGQAVFSIRISKNYMGVSKTGSGFFVNPDGTAYAELSLIDGANELAITTADGQTYRDVSILSADRLRNLAVLKVNGGGPFPAVQPASPDTVKMHQTVYCIWNPSGEKNEIASGYLASLNWHPSGSFSKATYLQIVPSTAQSFNGGVAVNENGEGVGLVTSGYFGLGKTNLILSMDEAESAARFKPVSLQAYFHKTFDAIPVFESKLIVPGTPGGSQFSKAQKLENGDTIHLLRREQPGGFFSMDCERSGMLLVALHSDNTEASGRLNFVSLVDSTGKSIETQPITGMNGEVRFYLNRGGTVTFQVFLDSKSAAYQPIEMYAIFANDYVES